MKGLVIAGLLILLVLFFGCMDLQNEIGVSEAINQNNLDVKNAEYYEVNAALYVDEEKLNVCRMFSTQEDQENCIYDLGLAYCDFLSGVEKQLVFQGKYVSVTYRDKCKYSKIEYKRPEIYYKEQNWDRTRYAYLKACYSIENETVRIGCLKGQKIGCDIYVEGNSKATCLVNRREAIEKFGENWSYFDKVDDLFIAKYYPNEDQKIT